MKFDIITFGSGLIDIFVYTDEKEHGKLIAYEVGSKIQVKDMKFDIGGGGVNTASTFSSMGLKTGFFGRLGEDEFAEKILDALKEHGIKFLGKSDGKTGYSVILDSREHDRTILTYKGSNDEILVKEKEINSLNADWFYFSSLVGKSFKSYKKIIKNKNVKLAFNPSLYLLKKENISPVLKKTNILILNKEEADLISRKHKKILGFGPEIVCVTNGKEPFYCYAKNREYKVYPHKNIRVVERTGAGDAFASGFLASYIKNQDIKKSLMIGVANSESVVSQFGARKKILTWEEAVKRIKKKGVRVVS